MFRLWGHEDHWKKCFRVRFYSVQIYLKTILGKIILVSAVFTWACFSLCKWWSSCVLMNRYKLLNCFRKDQYSSVAVFRFLEKFSRFLSRKLFLFSNTNTRFAFSSVLKLYLCFFEVPSNIFKWRCFYLRIFQQCYRKEARLFCTGPKDTKTIIRFWCYVVCFWTATYLIQWNHKTQSTSKLKWIV